MAGYCLGELWRATMSDRLPTLTMINRYTATATMGTRAPIAGIGMRENGGLVKYDDHVRAIADKDREIAKLQKVVDAARVVCETGRPIDMVMNIGLLAKALGELE